MQTDRHDTPYRIPGSSVCAAIEYGATLSIAIYDPIHQDEAQAVADFLAAYGRGEVELDDVCRTCEGRGLLTQEEDGWNEHTQRTVPCGSCRGTGRKDTIIVRRTAPP